MKQPEHVSWKAYKLRGRRPLSLVFLPICVVCLLLLASQLLVGNGLMPQSAIARGITRHSHSPRVIKIPGHAHRLAGKKQRVARHATKHAIQHGQSKKQKKQVALGVPTATATASAKPSGPAPDLYIHQLRMGAPRLDVGKKLTYVLFSGNSTGAASVKKRGSIVIMDVLPLGLKDLKAQGKNWKISLSDTVSPTVLTATYDGPYPVKADTVLSPVFFTGLVTVDAGPSITNTVTVDAPNDTNASDSIATDTVYIGSTPQLMVAPVDDTSAGAPDWSTLYATPSVAALPSATPSVMATPSATALAVSSPEVVATPSATALAVSSPEVVATPSATALAVSSPEVVATPSATAVPSPTPVVTATAVPSSTPVVTPTPKLGPTPRVVSTPTMVTLAGAGTATPTAIATPSMGPKLTISTSRPGAPTGDTYTVGQRVSYVLQVTNTQAAENQVVSVFDIAAVGISDVTFTAPGWTLSASSTVGPAALSGTFNGPYPVAAGASLPPITVSGTLTSAAGPLFSNAAAVTSKDDPDSPANISVDSITVQPAWSPSPTATAATTPQATGVTTPAAVSGNLTPSATGNVTSTAVDNNTPPTIVAETTATAPAAPTMTMVPATTPAAISDTTSTDTSDQGMDARHAARHIISKQPRSSLALAIVNSNLYGTHGSVQGQVKLALVVANTGKSRAVAQPGTIIVDEVIPLGLSHLAAQGKDWRISLSDTISPAIIHAQYIGKAVLAPDMALPPIAISGVLNQEAVPIVTSTAAVRIAGTSDGDDAPTASDTLLVRNAWQQLR